jgi:hypothetical protein
MELPLPKPIKVEHKAGYHDDQQIIPLDANFGIGNRPGATGIIYPNFPDQPITVPTGIQTMQGEVKLGVPMPARAKQLEDRQLEEQDPTLFYERLKSEQRLRLVNYDKSKPQDLESGGEYQERKGIAEKLYVQYKAQVRNPPCKLAIFALFNPYDPLLELGFEDYGHADDINKPVWVEIDHEVKDESVNNARENGPAGAKNRRPEAKTEPHKVAFRNVIARFEAKLTTPELFADWIYTKKPKFKFAEMILRKTQHLWRTGRTIIPDSLSQCLIQLFLNQNVTEKVNIVALALTAHPEGFVIGNLFHALFEATFRVSFKDASNAMRNKFKVEK